MTDKRLLNFLDNEFTNLKLDKEFIKKVIMFRLDWLNRTEDRTEFISGYHLGVYTVYFTLQDNISFFDKILDVELSVIQDKIKQLPYVNSDYLISSDAFNIIIMYLIHKVYKDKILIRIPICLQK